MGTVEGGPDDLSLMGRKVGNRSRLPPEKLPRIDPDEVGGAGSGTGLRPGCEGCSPIPNTFPGRTSCGWEGMASNEPPDSVVVIIMGGRGILVPPVVTPRTGSAESGSDFPTLMRGTPNLEISLEPPGGGPP